MVAAPPVRGHRDGLDVDQQRQRPAHVAALEFGALKVEQQGRQRRIGVGVGEVLEPAARSLGLLGEREHALGRHVVDDIEVMVHLRDHALVGRAAVHINRVFRPRFAEPPQRSALPVVAALPDEPFALWVVAVQRVGAERNWLIEVEPHRIRRLFEDMLRHDPDGVEAHRE